MCVGGGSMLFSAPGCLRLCLVVTAAGALSGCAALSDRVTMRDGKPCNALCQRWMGLGEPPSKVLKRIGPVPKSATTPVDAAHETVHAHRLRRGILPLREATSAREPLRSVAMRPASDQPLRDPTVSQNAWGRPVPGSVPALPGGWAPNP